MKSLPFAMENHLQRLQRAIALATSELGAEALQAHPPGKWSVAEILEHLSLGYSATTKGLGRCLEAGKPLAGPVRLRHRLYTLVVIDFGYLPSGRVAPRNTQPRGMPAEEARGGIGRELEALDQAISACRARFGEERLLDHPVLGPLSGAEWCRFHWIHGRHHLRQISRLRSPG